MSESQLSGRKRGRTLSDDNNDHNIIIRTSPLTIPSITVSAVPSVAPSVKKRRKMSLNNYIEQYENTIIGEKTFKNYISTLKRDELPEPISGGTSRVFIIKINNVKYAMKRVNISLFSESLFKEIRSLSILNENKCECSPYLIAIAKQNEFVYLLMSYTEGKTLDNWLKTNPSEPEKVTRHNELKAALAKIHTFNIIHADIKPSNIWIPNDPTIPAYFIDFGSSIKDGEKANSFTVSPEGSPLESESATKTKNITALDKLFLKRSGGGKTRRSQNRKKLNKSRRYYRHQ